MTLPASSFAEAQRVLKLFSEAQKSKPYVAPEDDIEFVQYYIPDDSSDNMGAYHLIMGAMNIVDRNCRMVIGDGYVRLQVPTHLEKCRSERIDKFPLALAQNGLHDLRRHMLRGLSQEADGTITLSTDTPYPGLRNVDMRNVVQSLVNRNQLRHSQKPRVEIGAQYRNSEEAIAHLKANAQHRQSLPPEKQVLAAAFDKENAPRKGTTLEMSQVRFHAQAVVALYDELGVDMRARGVH